MPVHVASCALSDSLLGGAKPDGHIMGAYDSVRNVTYLDTQQLGFVRMEGGLSGGVNGTSHFDGRDPTQVFPVTQLNIRIVEPTERSIEQRQLTITFDDSISVDLGSMSMNPQRLPGTPGISMNLFVVLPQAQFYALARARRVTGRVGPTSFEITRQRHQNLRTLFIATACGLAASKL